MTVEYCDQPFIAGRQGEDGCIENWVTRFDYDYPWYSRNLLQG